MSDCTLGCCVVVLTQNSSFLLLHLNCVDAAWTLWAIHNKVSERLSHEATKEQKDPAHPKILFPAAGQCAECSGKIYLAVNLILLIQMAV